LSEDRSIGGTAEVRSEASRPPASETEAVRRRTTRYPPPTYAEEYVAVLEDRISGHLNQNLSLNWVAD